MTGSGEKQPKRRKSGSRDERLAAALRENLRRRKAQERARASPDSHGPQAKPAARLKEDDGLS